MLTRTQATLTAYATTGYANTNATSLVDGSLEHFPIGMGVIDVISYAREVLGKVMLKAHLTSWSLETLDVESPSKSLWLPMAFWGKSQIHD